MTSLIKCVHSLELKENNMTSHTFFSPEIRIINVAFAADFFLSCSAAPQQKIKTFLMCESCEGGSLNQVLLCSRFDHDHYHTLFARFAATAARLRLIALVVTRSFRMRSCRSLSCRSLGSFPPFIKSSFSLSLGILVRRKSQIVG